MPTSVGGGDQATESSAVVALAHVESSTGDDPPTTETTATAAPTQKPRDRRATNKKRPREPDSDMVESGVATSERTKGTTAHAARNVTDSAPARKKKKKKKKEAVA